MVASPVKSVLSVPSLSEGSGGVVGLPVLGPTCLLALSFLPILLILPDG